MSDNADSQVAAVSFVVVGAVATVALAMLWKAFIFKSIWAWYAVPLGLPSMNWPCAFAIPFAMRGGSYAKSGGKPDGKHIAMVMVAEAVTLLVAYGLKP